jgi:hypothetical protein
MSFRDLNDFEGTVKYLKQGASSVASISSFFKQMKRGTDTYASFLLKISQNFKHDLPMQGNMDTLSTALSAFTVHVGQLAGLFNSLGSGLQLEVIEPLDLFAEHYNASNSKEIATGTETLSRMKKSREQMVSLQDKYFKSSLEIEKLEGRQDVKTAKQMANLKTSTARLGAAYLQAFEQSNKCLADHEEALPEVMGNLQQNEESRMHFIKYTLEKYARSQQRTANSLTTMTNDLSDVLSNINSSLDIRVYVDSHRLQTHGLVREEFLSFEAWRKRSRDASAGGFREEDFITLDDEWDSPTDQDAYLIKAAVNALVSPREDDRSETEALPDLYKLTDLLQTSNGRSLFCTELEKRSEDCSLSSYNLTQLAAIVYSLLTCMYADNDTDPSAFYNLVVLAQTFYSQSDDGRRRLLSSLISGHQIWSDQARWENCINCVVAAKISAERESVQKQRSPAPKRGIFSKFKSFANKIPQVFQQKEAAYVRADGRADKSAYYMVLSQFSFYMTSLGLAVEPASEVLFKICSRAQLDSERTCGLLAELQANQKGSKTLVSTRKSSRSIPKRRENKLKKWGELLPIAQTLEYLAVEDLLTLVAVCKLWHSQFRRQVYLVQLQSVPIRSSLQSVTRSRYWRHMLQPHIKHLDYPGMLERIQLNPEIVKSYDEIIRMDVARSFHNHPQISGGNLSNLLRTYSLYNTEVGYCQGMNYIAGTLYLQLQDEATAFKCMVGLVEKYHMSPLFYQDLPRLKLYLYQLDRLVGIHLPEVQSMFKEEMITSSHFASSWFITLFSSVLHHTPERVEVLLQIWDMFFSVKTTQQGWKAIFKAGLAILMRLSEKFSSGRFEEMMTLLTNINSPVFSSEIFDAQFIALVREVPVTNAMLRDLESEYEHLKLRASVLTKAS